MSIFNLIKVYMMKIKNMLAGCLIASLLLPSCAKNLLNLQPTDQVNDELLWQNQSMVLTYTANFYAQLPSACLTPYPGGYLPWLLSDLTDDADAANPPVGPYTFFTSYDASSSPLNGAWTSRYQYIRRANVFLQNIDGVPGDKSLNQRMKGEIKFIRAFFYFDLMNWFGGVPIITTPQNDIDSTAFLPRNSMNECTDFLVSELTYAADSCLPASYTADQWGRITQGTALALMCRAQLYAGRWADAAATAKRIMGLGVYALQPSYASVFSNTNKMNTEVILSVQANNSSTQLGNYFDNYNQPPGYNGHGGYTCPTQNLVDDYEMQASGLPVTDPASGYNPQAPYTGRDPRFAASVLYDSAVFKGRAMQMYTGGYDVTAGGSINAAWITKTGYYLRKFMDETIDLTNPNSVSSQNWILFRYAEVLLNYAEAQNEASGPDASVYTAVNAIRERAGMPDLKTGLSQDGMRTAIRHERRIELVFEDERYWDIKRWQLATTQFSTATTPIKNMTITLNPVTGSKTYTEGTVTETRIFVDKEYLFPLPSTELAKPGNKMIQNPGW
jgi:hypothetical protein